MRRFWLVPPRKSTGRQPDEFWRGSGRLPRRFPFSRAFASHSESPEPPSITRTRPARLHQLVGLGALWDTRRLPGRVLPRRQVAVLGATAADSGRRGMGDLDGHENLNKSARAAFLVGTGHSAAAAGAWWTWDIIGRSLTLANSPRTMRGVRT